LGIGVPGDVFWHWELAETGTGNWQKPALAFCFFCEAFFGLGGLP
jgi:hypothetical protein